MPHADPLDGIEAAAVEAREAGHDLRGFTRRSGSFGYRFEARCHSCGLAIAVERGSDGWEHSGPIVRCPGPG